MSRKINTLMLHKSERRVIGDAARKLGVAPATFVRRAVTALAQSVRAARTAGRRLRTPMTYELDPAAQKSAMALARSLGKPLAVVARETVLLLARSILDE